MGRHCWYCLVYKTQTMPRRWVFRGHCDFLLEVMWLSNDRDHSTHAKRELKCPMATNTFSTRDTSRAASSEDSGESPRSVYVDTPTATTTPANV